MLIIIAKLYYSSFHLPSHPFFWLLSYKSSLLCGIMAIWTMDRNFDTWVRLLWLPRIIIAAEIVTTLLTQQLLVESWKYDHLDPDMHDLRPNRWKTGHVCEKSKLCCDKRCYCNAMGSVMYVNVVWELLSTAVTWRLSSNTEALIIIGHWWSFGIFPRFSLPDPHWLRKLVNH